MFSVFRILATYVDTSGINCNMNYLIAIQAVILWGAWKFMGTLR